MKQTESLLQQACVRWFRHLPGIDSRFLIAIPNEGKRTEKTGRRMRAEGMIAGVSDLILFHPKAEKKPLFLECKLPKGKQQETQIDFERVVTEGGYQYKIFRSFEEFEEIVLGFIGKETSHERKPCIHYGPGYRHPDCPVDGCRGCELLWENKVASQGHKKPHNSDDFPGFTEGRY